AGAGTDLRYGPGLADGSAAAQGGTGNAAGVGRGQPRPGKYGTADRRADSRRRARRSAAHARGVDGSGAAERFVPGARPTLANGELSDNVTNAASGGPRLE